MKLLTRGEICQGKEFKNLFKCYDQLLNIPGEFNLMECKTCGVKFLNPQPTYKELEKYYTNEKYYSLKKVDTNSYKTKLKLFLYDLYFNRQNKNYFYKILFSPIKFMVRTAVIKKDSKLLDIGCGSGQFLYEMKHFGLDVHGIDPGEFNEDYADELKLIKNDLMKKQYPDEFFDIITMNHVFEHINNPKEMTKEIYRILKPKGTFIIGLPNTRSLANKLFNKNWLAYDIPRHLFNYSDEQIITFLKKNKFRIKGIRYNSRPTQFVMSLYYLFNIKKRNGKLNKLLEVLFIPLTLFVNLMKLGDQIEVVCIK